MSAHLFLLISLHSIGPHLHLQLHVFRSHLIDRQLSTSPRKQYIPNVLYLYSENLANISTTHDS
jgi:hypothetical protein